MGNGLRMLTPSSIAASLCGYLQHGANEDAVDAENRSPLHWAGACLGTGGKKPGKQDGRITFGGDASH